MIRWFQRMRSEMVRLLLRVGWSNDVQRATFRRIAVTILLRGGTAGASEGGEVAERCYD